MKGTAAKYVYGSVDQFQFLIMPLSGKRVEEIPIEQFRLQPQI